jgi:hypothetical protein
MNIEEEIKKVIEEQFGTTGTIINFYGCSFNFANDGCAEARYYMGDEVYNRGKED